MNSDDVFRHSFISFFYFLFFTKETYTKFFIRIQRRVGTNIKGKLFCLPFFNVCQKTEYTKIKKSANLCFADTSYNVAGVGPEPTTSGL